MSDDNGNANGRISVSEDKLRAIMAEFELRLRSFIEDKLENKADLVMLNHLRKDFAKLEDRVEADLSELDDRVNVLERWRYGLAMLATAALLLAGFVAQHYAV